MLVARQINSNMKIIFFLDKFNCDDKANARPRYNNNPGCNNECI